MNSQYAEHLDYIFRFDMGTPALGLFGHSTRSTPFLQDTVSCETMPPDVLAARLRSACDRSMVAKKQGNPKQSIVEARWVARVLNESLATAFGATIYALYHPSHQKSAWSWFTQADLIAQSLVHWCVNAQVICAHHSRLFFRSMKLYDVVLLAVGLCQLAMQRLGEEQPNQVVQDAQLLPWLWPPEVVRILPAFFLDIGSFVVYELAQRIVLSVPSVEEQSFSVLLHSLPRHFFCRLVVMTRLYPHGSVLSALYQESPPGTLAVLKDILMNQYLTVVLHDQLEIFDPLLTQLLLSDKKVFATNMATLMDAVALFLQQTFFVDKNVPYLKVSIVAYLLVKKEVGPLTLFFAKCPIAQLHDLLATTHRLLPDHDLVTEHLLFFFPHLFTKEIQDEKKFFFQHIQREFWQSFFQTNTALSAAFYQYLCVQGPAIFAEIRSQLQWLDHELAGQKTACLQLSQPLIRVCIHVLGWVFLLERAHQTKTLSAFFPMQTHLFSFLRSIKKKCTSVDVDKMIVLSELTLFFTWVSQFQYMEWMDPIHTEIHVREKYIAWLHAHAGLTKFVQRSAHKIAFWLRTVFFEHKHTHRWFDPQQYQAFQNLVTTDLATYTSSVMEDMPTFFCHMLCAVLLHFSLHVMTSILAAAHDALLDDFLRHLRHDHSQDEISRMLRCFAEKPGDAYQEMSSMAATFWQTLLTHSGVVLELVEKERARRALARVESVREMVAHWLQQCMPEEWSSSTLTLTWEMLAALREIAAKKNTLMNTDLAVSEQWLHEVATTFVPLIHVDLSSFVRVVYAEDQYECAIFFQQIFVELGMDSFATLCEPFMQQTVQRAHHVPSQHMLNLLDGLRDDNTRKFLDHFYSFTKSAHYFSSGTGSGTTAQDTNKIRTHAFLIHTILHPCDVSFLKKALVMLRHEKYLAVRAHISLYADQLWCKDNQKSNMMHMLSGVMWSILDRSLAHRALKDAHPEQYDNALLFKHLDSKTRAIIFAVFDIAMEDIDHTILESQGHPLKFGRRLKC